MMKTRRLIYSGCVVMALMALLVACVPQAPPAQPPLQAEVASTAAQMAKKKVTTEAISEEKNQQLPVRYQQPSYLVQQSEARKEMGPQTEEFLVPVGADISSTAGPISLRDIMKRLASLKNMNVSWSSDVNQNDLVDVDIRADDDFFKAIDNILRQRDYFYEVQDNTIVVKYKETRRFHIAMPFTTSTYDTGVGGNVLGGSSAGAGMNGNLAITSAGNKFDVWDNIQKNLDKVMEIWTSDTAASQPAPAATPSDGTSPLPPVASTPPRQAQGYYTIDRPIGVITVTAPRPLLEKIAEYLDHLKQALYRQISIEAKIIEVVLSDTSQTGIDWKGLFKDRGLNFDLFGGTGAVYPEGGQWISRINFTTSNFNIIMNAIEEQGKTNILSNPKISVMNGQPAMISVGENRRFISQVTSNMNDNGFTSYTATTADVLSGLGMGVIATIIDDDTLILQLTPVTTDLTKLEDQDVGEVKFKLPTVSVREMSTTVKIKNGEMLVVGGLIDNNSQNDNTKVPVLSDLPILNKLFKSETKSTDKKELIIILQAQILP